MFALLQPCCESTHLAQDFKPHTYLLVYKHKESSTLQPDALQVIRRDSCWEGCPLPASQVKDLVKVTPKDSLSDISLKQPNIRSDWWLREADSSKERAALCKYTRGHMFNDCVLSKLGNCFIIMHIVFGSTGEFLKECHIFIYCRQIQFKTWLWLVRV